MFTKQFGYRVKSQKIIEYCVWQKSVSNGKMIVFCFVIDLHARNLVNSPIPHLIYLAMRESLKRSAKYQFHGIHFGIS